MMAVVGADIFYDEAGRFSATRWIEYWQRVWSDRWPPAVYLDRTRVGVRQLADLADALLAEIDSLREESGVTGTPAADPWRAQRETVVEQIDAIGNVWLPLARTVETKAAAKTLVATPLLTRGDAPLIELGSIIGSVETAAPMRSWTEIASELIEEHVTDPLARSVGAPVRRLLWIAGLGFGAYLLWKSGAWKSS